jgi:hypothetical protein
VKEGEGNPATSLIWVGDNAVLDAAARAATATDRHGRTYGLVADGGTIRIGGALDWEETGRSLGPDAFVVIRPGALLDASGGSAKLDIPSSIGTASRSVMVASDGGSIILKSNNGLYLDGMLRAAAGGEGAAGGTLALALASPIYSRATTSGAILSPREFILAQTQGDSLLPGDVDAAEAAGLLKVRTGRLGVDRVEAGGFDNLAAGRRPAQLRWRCCARPRPEPAPLCGVVRAGRRGRARQQGFAQRALCAAGGCHPPGARRLYPADDRLVEWRIAAG